MCGRYTLTSPHDAVAEAFETGAAPEFPPRFNLAPSQESVIVTSSAEDGRRARGARWGLDPARGDASRLLINARSETAATLATFRRSFVEKRCLVPANGFFEWARIGRVRQPYYITSRELPLVGFAGLWFETRTGEPSYVILTTAANDVVARVHERMPVIVSPRKHDLWLGPGALSESSQREIRRPWPAADTLSRAVGLRVNDANRDEPGCIEPVVGPVDLFTN